MHEGAVRQEDDAVLDTLAGREHQLGAQAQIADLDCDGFGRRRSGERNEHQKSQDANGYSAASCDRASVPGAQKISCRTPISRSASRLPML